MGRIWKSPFVRLAAYYVVLGLVTLALVRAFPQLRDLFEHFQELSPVRAVSKKDALETTGLPGPASLGSTALALITFLSMIGALALMAPTAWVYMITKQKRGYDQSVVQTVIVLPMTVAGTLILVQNSLALAFALGGIVAAIRFRNTLKDTKDVVYIYLALGVGLSAGVFAPVVAAVMSLVFNTTVLTLWRLNVGNIYADRLGADRAVRLEPHLQAAAERKKRFNGALLIRAARVEPAQRVAEALFDKQVKPWKLAEIVPSHGGTSTLEYLVRLKDDGVAAALLDALKAQGAPDIVAAEFRSLRGLKHGRAE
jgi:hypothetical protein